MCVITAHPAVIAHWVGVSELGHTDGGGEVDAHISFFFVTRPVEKATGLSSVAVRMKSVSWLRTPCSMLLGARTCSMLAVCHAHVR